MSVMNTTYYTQLRGLKLSTKLIIALVALLLLLSLFATTIASFLL